MAVENANTYPLDVGVDVVFEDHWILDYASKRATQLEALAALLMTIDTESAGKSLMNDVLWIAKDLAEEMKELVKAVHAQGMRQAQHATEASY